MDLQWIEHRGKEILSVDYSGIKMEKDMIVMLNKVPSMIQDKQQSDKLLLLVNLTNCYTTPGFIDAAKKQDKELFDKYVVKRAVLGIEGPKAILLKGFNLFAKQKLEPFRTKDDALDYLIKS